MSSLDLDECISTLYAGKVLSMTQVRHICRRLVEELLESPNIVQVSLPVSIVGDIHGQFYDLLELFKVGGFCPEVNYLFLGDYVDRGYYSVNTICLLICLRLRYPDRITLLRGNHETRKVTEIYGFYSECMRVYGHSDAWEEFVRCFNHLNIAAMVGTRILCVHGGLSPSVSTIDDIRTIDRQMEVPHSGPFADLMWSDPDGDTENQLFMPSQRGCGYLFGREAVKQFNHKNGISQIVRAHQLCMDGYEEHFEGSLVTVWSAPNYCYRCGNVASIMEISQDGKKEFNIFLPCPADERKALDLETNRSTPSYFL